MYTNADCFTISKQTELKCYIQQAAPDIIAITEILPKHTVFELGENHFSIDGYTMFCTDLTKGRGCVCYIKSNISAIKVQLGDNFQESVWCSVNLTGSDKLLVGCIYRSPSSSIENNQELLNLFLQVRDLSPSHILILGDFNLREIDWRTDTANANEEHIASKFLECVRDCFLYQHIRDYTRFREGSEPSVLDLLFTNEEHMINSVVYSSGLGKSDHLQLQFTFNCYTEIIPRSFTKFNFFKGNYTGLSRELDSVDWPHILEGIDLSASWEILTEKISNLLETYIPVSKVSSGTGKKTPYITQSCYTAIRSKHTKWEKYLHCKTSQNYEIYKQARNKVITEMRRSKYDYEKNLATKIKTDSKLFWSYVRSKLKTKGELGQLEKQDGTLTSDSQEKAELLNKYFASVFEIEGLGVLPDFNDRNFDQF